MYWIVTLDSNTSNFSNTVNVQSGGLVPCGTVSTTNSLNILILNESNNAPINASIALFVDYDVGTAKTSAYTNLSSSNWTLCMNPNNTRMNLTATTTISATGFTTRTLTETYEISNTTTIKTYYLSGLTTPTQLKIIQTPNLLVSGVLISVYRFTAPSTYSFTDSCTTDAAGVCLVSLVPNINQYLYNFSYSGTNYSFGVEVLSCTGVIYYRTFTIGSAGAVPTQLTGYLSGNCAYSNITRVVQCNGSDSSATLTSFTLRANQLGNSTELCNQTAYGSTGSVSCTLPNVCGLYGVSFVGNDASGNTYSLSGAQVQTSSCARADYGRSGWLALLLLFGTLALVGAWNISIAMTLGSAALLVGLAIGLIPFEANAVIFVSMAVLGTILSYRLKV
jgi:hypothetical protein